MQPPPLNFPLFTNSKDNKGVITHPAWTSWFQKMADQYSKVNQYAADPVTTNWGQEHMQIWFNTTQSKLKYWNGTSIVTLG